MYDASSSAYLWGRPVVGRVVGWIRPGPQWRDLKSWLGPVPGLSFGSRVLDIGCGSGTLLRRMRNAGFRQLRGVDPFNREEIVEGDSLQISACGTEVLPRRSFDLIMMHHVLEHIPDPVHQIEEIVRLLAPGGTCIVRIPLADSDPWEMYREQWVELDAPRHFTLFSRVGFEGFSRGHGLECWRTQFDGDSFAYWGSELYRRGVTLVDPHTKTYRSAGEFFASKELAEFDERAKTMNESGRSGRGVFYLCSAE